jgi:hypothetical protein
VHNAYDRAEGTYFKLQHLHEKVQAEQEWHENEQRLQRQGEAASKFSIPLKRQAFLPESRALFAYLSQHQ